MITAAVAHLVVTTGTGTGTSTAGHHRGRALEGVRAHVVGRRVVRSHHVGPEVVVVGPGRGDLGSSLGSHGHALAASVTAVRVVMRSVRRGGRTHGAVPVAVHAVHAGSLSCGGLHVDTSLDGTAGCGHNGRRGRSATGRADADALLAGLVGEHELGTRVAGGGTTILDALALNTEDSTLERLAVELGDCGLGHVGL